MTAWVLNTVALFATTFGALLLFLHLHRAALLFRNQAPEVKQIYEKHTRGLLIGLGLLATWFVGQAIAVILPL
jgi:hypothetical protein